MLANLQIVIFLAIAFVAFGLEAWAFIDALIRPPAAFVANGKRTKNFWVLVTGVAAAFGFIALPPMSAINPLGFLTIIAVVASIVYLVDVRPAVKGPKRPRGGSGPRGGW